jgi:hypothetical protein
MKGTVRDDVLSDVVTSRDIVTERTCSPTVPETVAALVPCAIELVELIVRIEVSFPETDEGLNDPTAFAGRPDIERATEELNP